MNWQVPPEKMVRSFAISAVALVAAFVLEWLQVTNASPLAVALLAPLVNYVRELAKSNPTDPPATPPPAAPATPAPAAPSATTEGG